MPRLIRSISFQECNCTKRLYVCVLVLQVFVCMDHKMKKSCQCLHLLLALDLWFSYTSGLSCKAFFQRHYFDNLQVGGMGNNDASQDSPSEWTNLCEVNPLFLPSTFLIVLDYRFASCCTTTLAGRGWCVSAQERPCKMLICSTRG